MSVVIFPQACKGDSWGYKAWCWGSLRSREARRALQTAAWQWGGKVPFLSHKYNRDYPSSLPLPHPPLTIIWLWLGWSEVCHYTMSYNVVCFRSSAVKDIGADCERHVGFNIPYRFPDLTQHLFPFRKLAWGSSVGSVAGLENLIFSFCCWWKSPGIPHHSHGLDIITKHVPSTDFLFYQLDFCFFLAWELHCLSVCCAETFVAHMLLFKWRLFKWGLIRIIFLSPSSLPSACAFIHLSFSFLFH